MSLVRTSLRGMHTALPETADRGPRAHRAPGRCRAHTSRKIPVRPPQCCPRAVRATSTVGLASGPPGGRRAASTLDRATRTVCHTAGGLRQSSRRDYPWSDVGQTGAAPGARRVVSGGGAGGDPRRSCPAATAPRRREDRRRPGPVGASLRNVRPPGRPGPCSSRRRHGGSASAGRSWPSGRC